MFLIDLFKKIFVKKDKLLGSTNDEESHTQISNVNKNTYFDEMRTEMQRRDYLLKQKRKFENKEICESEISEEDKAGIKNIYYEQIGLLNRKIRNSRNKLN